MGDMDDFFLDSFEWRDRLKRTLLYPGNQSIDFTMPIQVSELCVNSFRSFAPKNESKLGLRVATRLTRNSCLSPSVVMMALIYLKRLREQDPSYLNRVSSSDLFVVSTMVASKFLFDDGTEDECYNDDWACGVGMKLDKLNKLEIDFLNALNWNLNVPKEEFHSELESIESELSKLQMSRTNMFTYNNARNINLSATMLWTIQLVSKVFFFSTIGTICFLKCLDISTQFLQSYSNTNTDSVRDVRVPPINDQSPHSCPKPSACDPSSPNKTLDTPVEELPDLDALREALNLNQAIFNGPETRTNQSQIEPVQEKNSKQNPSYVQPTKNLESRPPGWCRNANLLQSFISHCVVI